MCKVVEVRCFILDTKNQWMESLEAPLQLFDIFFSIKLMLALVSAAPVVLIIYHRATAASHPKILQIFVGRCFESNRLRKGLDFHKYYFDLMQVPGFRPT